MSKTFLKGLFLIIFSMNVAHSTVIEKIEIDGNVRVNNETIKMFSGVKIGEDLSKNESCRVIILESNSKIFCAGADLKELHEMQKNDHETCKRLDLELFNSVWIAKATQQSHLVLIIMKHLYMVEVMEIHPTLFTIIFIVEKEVFILWIM